MSTEKTGAQILAEAAERSKLVKMIADQMNLRKWAADRAVEMAMHSSGITGALIKETAQFLYDFVTAE